ncbi:MAG: hypothetical protein GXO64_03135, partial [Candidatus Micrarchaeota archaeon]|nr:hypothetical protein [Candidatus Micrarchaeota archaeon]
MNEVFDDKKQESGELGNLIVELKKSDSSLIDFLIYLRQKWLKDNTKDDKAFIENVIGRYKEILFPDDKTRHFEEIIRKKHYDWGDIKTHLSLRLTEHRHLLGVIEEIDPELKSIVKRGYNLSIMPLALVTRNRELLSKFIPKKDFFTDHTAKSWDPYGIFG